MENRFAIKTIFTGQFTAETPAKKSTSRLWIPTKPFRVTSRSHSGALSNHAHSDTPLPTGILHQLQTIYQPKGEHLMTDQPASTPQTTRSRPARSFTIRTSPNPPSAISSWTAEA